MGVPTKEWIGSAEQPGTNSEKNEKAEQRGTARRRGEGLFREPEANAKESELAARRATIGAVLGRCAAALKEREQNETRVKAGPTRHPRSVSFLTPASRLVSARAAARQGMSTRWGCVEASSSSHYLLHTALADGLVQFNLTCPCWI